MVQKITAVNSGFFFGFELLYFVCSFYASAVHHMECRKHYAFVHARRRHSSTDLLATLGFFIMFLFLVQCDGIKLTTL